MALNGLGLAALVAGAALALVALLVRRRFRAGAKRSSSAGEAQYRAVFDSAVEAMVGDRRRGTPSSPSTRGRRGCSATRRRSSSGGNMKMLMPPKSADPTSMPIWAVTPIPGERSIIGIGREVSRPAPGRQRLPARSVGRRVACATATPSSPASCATSSARQDAEAEAARERRAAAAAPERVRASSPGSTISAKWPQAIAHEINQPLTAIVNYLNTGAVHRRRWLSPRRFRRAPSRWCGWRRPRPCAPATSSAGCASSSARAMGSGTV